MLRLVGEILETINYTQKNYADLFQSFLDKAQGHGLLSDDEHFREYVENLEDVENTLILDLSVMALVLDGVYDDLTSVYGAISIGQAKGDDLDAIGAQYLPRLQAAAAVTELLIYSNEPAFEDVLIPQGTVIYKNAVEDVFFLTLEDVTLFEGHTEVTVPIMCTEKGPQGNVVENTVNQLVEPITGISGVRNPYPTYGGRNIEEDDFYRLRLFKWKYLLSKGTFDAVNEAVKAVPGIRSYQIDAYWDGYGSTKIVVDPPLDYIITLSKAAVDAVKALDEDITFFKVEEITINVASIVNITLDDNQVYTDYDKEIFKNKINTAIKTYIDGGTRNNGTLWGGIGIGADFIPFKASVFVSEEIPEIKEMVFTFPSASVPISTHERAKCGTINITVV